MEMNRIGYYVEGRYFGNRVAQAIAFAEHRVREFGRAFKVEQKDHTGQVWLVKLVVTDEVKPAPERVDIVDPACQAA